MNVTVHIPWPLRDCCAGAAEVQVPAATVRDALAQLETRYPALYRSVCDETGTVRRHINLFINTSLVRRPEGLESALSPEDVLWILPAVSGG